jgi:hypothetical protein
MFKRNYVKPTPWREVFLKELLVAHGTLKFIKVFTRAPHWNLPLAR